MCQVFCVFLEIIVIDNRLAILPVVSVPLGFFTKCFQCLIFFAIITIPIIEILLCLCLFLFSFRLV